MTARLTALLAAALLLALVAAGCGGEDDEPAAEPSATATAGGAECRPASPPPPDDERDRYQAPSRLLAPGMTYRAEVRTSCGAFTITLDPGSAPRAVASFVALARKDFFDGVMFHRIVPGFVIQGGDPTATGSGGPGYETQDAPKPDWRYTRGVVAMAKATTAAPGAAGSQFFVVTGEGVQLPPEYPVIGRVTAGLGVVMRIGELGDVETEQPTQTVVIDDVRVLVG